MVKEVSDYVDQVQEKFPFWTKSEIKQILIYGCKRYVEANRQHVDVTVYPTAHDQIVAHTGRLGITPLKAYHIYCAKYRMKERYKYKLRKTKWDGYYYIGLTENQHKKINKKSKKITFEKVFLTKVKKELYHTKSIKHIWRVPMPAQCGWKFYQEKFVTNDAEYVGPNPYKIYNNAFLKGL